MHPILRRSDRSILYRISASGMALRARLLGRRVRHFLVHGILHADDPPQRLALGAAIGTFIAITPTIGFQMMLVVLLAWLFRANKALGVTIVWITNPATIVPIYYPCYVVGRELLGAETVGLEWWQTLRNPPAGWIAAVRFYWSRMMEIALPLWVGSVVIGILLAAVVYYAVYTGVRCYRLKRWGQLVPPRAASSAMNGEKK